MPSNNPAEFSGRTNWGPRGPREELVDGLTHWIGGIRRCAPHPSRLLGDALQALTTVRSVDRRCRVVGPLDNRQHFGSLLDVGDNANNWLMIPLVDICVAAGLRLSADQCYGYKVPPLLGGSYELDNVTRADLSVHYSFPADIYRQTKDVPDGAQIRVVVD